MIVCWIQTSLGGASQWGSGKRRGAARETSAPPPTQPTTTKNKKVTATGRGQHLGSDVAWQFRFRRDGAFFEEVRSRHLTFRWGYDGGAASACWEVDPAGLSKPLEYDDHESLVRAVV